MKDLTHNQTRVLQYIVHCTSKGEPVPAANEISAYFSLSSASSGYQYLSALAKRGYLDIQQRGKGSRSDIRVTRKTMDYFSRTPLLRGHIPAGDLDLSPLQNDDHQNIIGIQQLIPSARPGDFLIRVKGNSMIDAGIEDGDLALIRPKKIPKQGDICAVWVDGEGETLKSLISEGDSVHLVPYNENFPKKTFPASDVRIQGVLVATLGIKIVASDPRDPSPDESH